MLLRKLAGLAAVVVETLIWFLLVEEWSPEPIWVGFTLGPKHPPPPRGGPIRLPQVDRPGSMDKVVTSLQAILRFLESFAAPRDWTPIVLQGDWLRYDAAHATAQFVVDPLGRVELTGTVASAGGLSATIGQLPPDARPITTKEFTCALIGGGATVVSVDVTGLVTIAPAVVAVSLDSIRFDTRA